MVLYWVCKEKKVKQIEDLKAVLGSLGKSDREFAQSLIDQFYKKGISPKQLEWVIKLTDRAKAPKSVLPTVNVGSFTGVVDLFKKAGTKLKWPKITLLCQGKQVRLAVAGSGSKAPGSINVMGEGQFPNREWFGRVSPSGEWFPGKAAGSFLSDLEKLLIRFGKDPAGVAKEFGALTGNCCFCSRPLSDVRSTAAGFGPVCAENYGLTDEWKTAVKKAESLVLSVSA
jgi:hypothetical protein